MDSHADENKRRILIVGDWLVDEHWVTGIHRTPTSSRAGQTHSRALHSLNSTVAALCGAGQTASILYQAKFAGTPFCEIIGLGLWHEKDTEALAAMLDSCSSRKQTPHRITREIPDITRAKL